MAWLRCSYWGWRSFRGAGGDERFLGPSIGEGIGMKDPGDDPTIDRRRGGAVGPADLTEGTEVGEYRVLSKIGEGGMGSVYAAVHPVIGKRVAIKVLAPHIAANPELVRRFVDEARAVNKIGHPNIVDIFSFGWLKDQRHYFAMEFLDGLSLADRIKRGPFEPDEARRLLRQICQALEAAHRQGIVHRDLKPDNIWIVQPQHGESYAKLLDFGIAKLMGDGDAGHRTQTGIVMGTPAYMSPEQCRGVNVEKGTDIYAIGMILYEIYAGKLPFQGSFAELITHHLVTVPEPPSRHRPVARALDTLILRCLDKDPAQRPRSADELWRALDAALPAPGSPMPAFAPAAVAPSAPAAAAMPSQPDTFSPPPGRTASDLTMQPARQRGLLLWIGAAVAVAGVVVVTLIGGRKGGSDNLVVVTDAQSPPAIVPPAPAPGRAHVVVAGVDGAKVMVDGKLVASGVREAHIPGLTAGEPHQLRVEAAGQPVHERTFTVASGAEAEIAVTFSPPPPPVVPAADVRAAHGKRTGVRAKEAAPATSDAVPTPAASKKRHRDSLVGDDIFGGSK
jgi:serine/threonine protein kinase